MVNLYPTFLDKLLGIKVNTLLSLVETLTAPAFGLRSKQNKRQGLRTPLAKLGLSHLRVIKLGTSS